jgi:hypothetical protein
MDFTKLVKSSASEMASFAKQNAMNLAILNDLRTARDGCKAREAALMIQGLITPLEKQLEKARASFDNRMNAIWKDAKGEKVPDDVQKELDKVLKDGAQTLKSKSGQDVKPNSDPKQKLWISSFAG